MSNTTAVLLSLLALIAATSHAIGAEKGRSPGGKAASQMSSKAKENTNAQWYADPDRGWVRAEERHDLKEERRGFDFSKGKGRKKSR
jgi:hypothetical protein